MEDGSNKKRGTKSRSKRSRKRPRSEKRNNDNLQVNFTVAPAKIPSLITDASLPILRTVEPYPYSFTSYAKARWIGKSVLDVYCSEFGSYPRSYYEQAIATGRILVSDERVGPDYQIQGKDTLIHTVHRHEPAVAVSSSESPYVSIVAETDSILAVDKPPTMPVHPCGGYSLNSLMSMLELSYSKLYTIHRLDRLTSGLVVLGKTSQSASEWGAAIKAGDCEKVYLTRVKGQFTSIATEIPRLADDTNAPTGEGIWTGVEGRKRNACCYWTTTGTTTRTDTKLADVLQQESSPRHILDSMNQTSDDSSEKVRWLHVACPVRIANHKDGICEAGSFASLDNETYDKTVKSALTSFAVVKRFRDSTVLLVKPSTGRTHQIRIHLQVMGSPIANDPNYGGDMWFGNQGGQRVSEAAQRLLDSSSSGRVSTDEPATEAEIQQCLEISRLEQFRSDDDMIRSGCVWCARTKGSSDTERSTLEFLVRSPGLWLHAFRYKKENEAYQTKVPLWAQTEAWVDDEQSQIDDEKNPSNAERDG